MDGDGGTARDGVLECGGCGVAAARAGKQRSELAGSWPGLGNADPEIRTKPSGAVMAQGWPVSQSPMTAATIRAIARTSVRRPSVRRPSSRPGLRAMRSPELTIATVLSSGHGPPSAAPSSTVMPRRRAVPYRQASGSGSPSAGAEIRSSVRRGSGPLCRSRAQNFNGPAGRQLRRRPGCRPRARLR